MSPDDACLWCECPALKCVVIHYLLQLDVAKIKVKVWFNVKAGLRLVCRNLITTVVFARSFFYFLSDSQNVLGFVHDIYIYTWCGGSSDRSLFVDPMVL